MNSKTVIYSAVVLILLLLIGSVSAWSWTDGQNYANAINVTVGSWTYTADYNGVTYNEGPVNYALIPLSDTGNGYLYSIRGYDAGGILIGNIVYSLVTYNSLYSVILLPNRTAGGVSWSTATVFYNPRNLDFTHSTIQKNSSLDVVTRLGTSPGLGGSQIFTMNYTPCTSGSTVGICINLRDYRGFAKTNFNLNIPPALNSNSVVIISNKSIVNEQFTINETIYTATNFYLFSVNGLYQLKNDGLFNFGLSQLSESPKNSLNANIIFGNNAGFEGWFSIPDNQILSEQLSVNESAYRIYNTVDSKPISIDLITPPRLQFGINTINTISFVFLPGFTSNIMKTLLPPNPLIPSTGAGILDFTKFRHITNVTWNYTYTTFAFPTNTNTAYGVKYTSGKVPYLIANVTYSSGMGASCYNIYLNTTSSESIPFYVLNSNSCQGSGHVSLLISNTTAGAHIFSDFLVWFDSPTNSGGFGQQSLFNSYKIAAVGQSSFSRIYYAGNVPFEVVLNKTIGLNSLITFPLATTESPVYMAYNGEDFLQSNQFVGANIPDRTGNSNRHILIDMIASDVNPAFRQPSLFTQTLSINTVYNNVITCTEQCVTLYNISNNVIAHGAHPFLAFANIVMGTSISANVVHLAANSYVQGPIQSVNSILICSPNCPAPTTGTHLNFTTTTINFMQNLNQTIVLIPGITLISWQAGIIVLMVLLLLGFALQTKENIIPAVGLIVLWMLGIWQIAFLGLAVLLTVLFAVYEYNEFRHRGGG